MKPEVLHSHVGKDAYGAWSAETQYRMPNRRILKVLTMKRYNGRYACTTSVVLNDGFFHTHVPYTDFHKVLASPEKFRGTEKAVREFHAQQTTEEQISALLDEAIKHYE